MPLGLTTEIDSDWVTEGPLATDELWTVHAGSVLVTLTEPTNINQGVPLGAGDSWEIRAGKTVRYRRASRSYAAINREPTGA